MSRRPSVSAALVAAILCPAVFAGSAVEPIEKLGLQRADMPVTIQKTAFEYPKVMDPAYLVPFGVRGLEAARYAYIWPAGGTLSTPIGTIAKEWFIEGEVFRAPSEPEAKRLYAMGVAARIGHFPYDAFPGEPKPLALPAYGDEQFGRVGSDPATGLGVMVFVRKGKVVWQLRVATIPLQFQVTREQLVAVLNTYALKQKSRIDLP
jgi:hypothetical protein